MAEGHAIEGSKLTRQFGGFFALRGVDLAVGRGEIRGLIGPNGAGKSTLIDVLSGRAEHRSGTVRMFGADISAMTAQQRRHAGLARSFQRTNIFPDLTVIDQLDIASRAAEMPNIDEIMAELNLTALAFRRAADISYGDQRRLDLALALIGRPKILLLDEPAAGLSVDEIKRLGSLITAISAQGTGVLLVEHHADLIFDICDRVTVLNLGKVLASGKPDEVRSHREVVNAYLGA